MNNLPLEGLQIINTRPKHQATTWSQQLRTAGAAVIDLPVMEIEATNQNWLSTVLPLEQFDQFIFTSINAVNHFFSALPSQHTLAPHSLISAVGKQTAKRLAEFSIKAHYPDIADSEHLLTMPHFQHVKNQTILIVKGVGGRRLIAQSLTKRGTKIKQANVYRRYCPKPKINSDNLWQDRKEKIILITSRDAVDNLFRMIPDAQTQLLRATWLVISKRIATYAQQKGVKHIIISDGEQLINTLTRHKQGLAHD